MTGLTRREFIQTTGGFVSVATLGAAMGDARGQEGRRPNILFLMTDQHNASVMGCSGNPVVKTPTLDKLAADGVRFTNALCSTPFCTPTRASLVTGLWPHTHGLVRNVQRGEKGLTDEATTTEQILFDKGSETFHMGKWHLGPTTDLRCYRKETELVSKKAYHQFVKANIKDRRHEPRDGEVKIGEVAYIPEMAKFHNVWKDEKRRSPQDISIIGRFLRPPELNYESWLADRCIDLIKKYKDKNFMITWSVSPPHAFWICPDPYYSMYDLDTIPFPSNWDHHPEAYQRAQSSRMGKRMGEKGLREYVRCYYGQVTMMDWCMGRILDALKEAGLDQNTLVIYTADHGDMQAAHGMVGKGLPAYYEEIVRVPFLMRHPTLKPGTVIDQHVNSVDMMPTLLDFAGTPIPKAVQGESLKPLVEGKVAGDDRPGFCERGRANKHAGRMIRTKQWKYTCFAHQNRRELFDLQNDPHEMTNLADSAEYRATLADLHKQLREHMEETADPARDVIPQA